MRTPPPTLSLPPRPNCRTAHPLPIHSGILHAHIGTSTLCYSLSFTPLPGGVHSDNRRTSGDLSPPNHQIRCGVTPCTAASPRTAMVGDAP